MTSIEYLLLNELPNLESELTALKSLKEIYNNETLTKLEQELQKLEVSLTPFQQLLTNYQNIESLEDAMSLLTKWEKNLTLTSLKGFNQQLTNLKNELSVLEKALTQLQQTDEEEQKKLEMLLNNLAKSQKQNGILLKKLIDLEPFLVRVGELESSLKALKGQLWKY